MHFGKDKWVRAPGKFDGTSGIRTPNKLDSLFENSARILSGSRHMETKRHPMLAEDSDDVLEDELV